jgi:hypothetical protein
MSKFFLSVLFVGALALSVSTSASASTVTLPLSRAAVPFEPLVMPSAPVSPEPPPAAAPPRSKVRPAPSAGGARPAWGPQLRAFDQR